jgi:hypothetical protein
VLDEPCAPDDAVHVHGDEDVDGLAGVARRVDDVGVEEDEAELLVAGEGGSHQGAPLGGGEAVGAGEDIRRADVFQEALELGGESAERDAMERARKTASSKKAGKRHSPPELRVRRTAVPWYVRAANAGVPMYRSRSGLKREASMGIRGIGGLDLHQEGALVLGRALCRSELARE